jgi:fucose 4-O-acetylase-like acetyltransferase
MNRTHREGADADRGTGTRLVGIDLVRVLGILAILAGHVWYSSDLSHLLTYSWHVPVFFMLSGYLWHDARSLHEELRHRWSSIIVPYIAWWLVVCVVYLTWAVVKGYGFALPLYYLALAAWGGALAFRPFTAFWFFSALVLAVLFLRLMQGRPAWWAWAGAVSAIVVCHVLTPVAVRSPLAVIQGVGCVFFVLVGIQLQRVRPRLHRPAWTGVALVIMGAALMVVPGYRPLEIKSADFGMPVVSVVVACLLDAGIILIAEWATQGIGNRTASVLTTLAACATVAILMHGVPMLLLETPRSGGLLDFIIVVAASIGLALLLVRTRRAAWLSGVTLLQ